MQGKEFCFYINDALRNDDKELLTLLMVQILPEEIMIRDSLTQEIAWFGFESLRQQLLSPKALLSS